MSRARRLVVLVVCLAAGIAASVIAYRSRAIASPPVVATTVAASALLTSEPCVLALAPQQGASSSSRLDEAIERLQQDVRGGRSPVLALNDLGQRFVAKARTTHDLSYYQRASGIQAVSLRFANVYGPRQDPEGEAGVVAIFIQKMLTGEQPVINGNGRQTRDFVFVEDVVEANLLVMGQGIDGVFNVGTSSETTVNELFAILKELTK